MNGFVAVCAGCALALIAPATSLAAEAHVEGTTVVYTGDPVRNQINVGGQAGPEFFQINDNGAAAVAPGPCRREDFKILCPVSQVNAARFELGDGDDELLTSGRDEGATITYLPMTVSGGPGNDLVSGRDANDVFSGGPGDDDLIGVGGNDVLAGDDGNDSVRGGDGDDLLDGGAGDDFVNGMDGNDGLKPGIGTDNLLGGNGDDVVDMRNGEADKGEAMCEQGSADSIVLEANDQVLEFRSGKNSWTVEGSCEKASGQAAPKPVYLFAGVTGRGRPTMTVDLIEGLPATIKVEFLARGRVVSRATAKRSGTRTVLEMRRTAAGRRYAKRFFVSVVARITVRDTGGRRSVTRKKLVAPRI